jgi:S-adenosylmethionine:tRNA ribosyltransferase-isomerase
MRTSDFTYHLPAELIAQYPAAQRCASRLLLLDQHKAVQDKQFSDFSGLLREGDLLVFNDTKVMAARMFGRKESGGKIEILLERLLPDNHALVQIRASKSPKSGSCLVLGDKRVKVEGRDGDMFVLSSETTGFMALMEEHGHMPLPPYIRRDDSSFDESRYQTVYADREGSVAAPTAGLHFDKALLEQLQSKGIDTAHVTLHVGAGTFQPVRVENLQDHVMHAEWLQVSQQVCDQITATKARGGRVIAVGTTSVRSLETAAAAGEIAAYEGDTRLFITPGYEFRIVDALLTNFHLPESTLLMLVCAFAGYEEVMEAYRHAVKQGYRFFSYGDAMFLVRKPQA